MLAEKKQKEKDLNMTDSYVSRDFYLCAYLVASGIDVQSYRKMKDGLTIFVFHNNEKLKEHVNNYFSPGAIVHPVKYGNAIRNLKGILHKTNENLNYVTQLTETR